MASALVIINAILSNEKYKPFLSLIKSFRNGVIYGCKVRFPHSLVMTFLWKTGPLSEKIRGILEATYTHGKNLALYNVIHKSIMYVLEWFSKKRRPSHLFAAGVVAGYFVFGNYNKVNEQINLYLMSRVLYALAQMATKKGYIPQPFKKPFPLFFSLVWGLSLVLFEYDREFLQPSLRSSMTYLYEDSTVWSTLRDFLLYNK
ncbi:peroxisomal membrane protein 4-like [Argonauta hians]